jgi:hypothetical protein
LATNEEIMASNDPQGTQRLTGARKGEETATEPPSVEELLFASSGGSAKKIVTKRKKTHSEKKKQKLKQKEMSTTKDQKEDRSDDAAETPADSPPAASSTMSPPVVPGSIGGAGPTSGDAQAPVTDSLPGSGEGAGPFSVGASTASCTAGAGAGNDIQGSVPVPASSTTSSQQEVGKDIAEHVLGAGPPPEGNPPPEPFDIVEWFPPEYTGDFATADLSLTSETRHIRKR